MSKRSGKETALTPAKKTRVNPMVKESTIALVDAMRRSRSGALPAMLPLSDTQHTVRRGLMFEDSNSGIPCTGIARISPDICSPTIHEDMQGRSLSTDDDDVDDNDATSISSSDDNLYQTEQDLKYTELKLPLASSGKLSSDVSWKVTSPIPGGPMYGSVIPSFLGHIACKIWEGISWRVLKCQNRYRSCQAIIDWYSCMDPATKKFLHSSGLMHLPFSMYSNIDHVLLSAFIERWQPDTNTFHMPFGEMTILLHDVWEILRIPVDGVQVVENVPVNDLKVRLAGLCDVHLSALGKGLWEGSGVVTDGFVKKCKQNGKLTQIRGILFSILGCTLFPDKSGSRMRPRDMVEAMHENNIGSYSWGSATLAYLYRQMGIASRSECMQIGGCMTLLQAWIYEYFPCFRPSPLRNLIDDSLPRCGHWNPSQITNSKERLQLIRTTLDQLTPSEVDWLPYGVASTVAIKRTLYLGLIRYRDIIEPYMPDRVVRQLGCVQGIPQIDIIVPDKVVRSSNPSSYSVSYSEAMSAWTWNGFPFNSRILLQGQHSVDLGRCDANYMEWYAAHSHPQLLPPQQPDSHTAHVLHGWEQWHGRWVHATRMLRDLCEEMSADQIRTTVEELEQIIRDFDRILGRSIP